MKNVLEINNISKFMGNKKIIDNLTFSVQEGEIFGFLGPNGAGKTTTIKMITGLITIDQGNILVNGFDIKKQFEKAISNIGGIIEGPDMYGYMSGLDNLKLYARMHGNVTKERILEVVKIVKLENRIKDKVKKYSLGMRQRLGVAQALLHNPKLLILDEPTNGLDPMGIKELRETLRGLTKEGISVLVSSHLLSEMELMCDRFCILDGGKLKDIKSISDIHNTTDKDFKTYLLDINKLDEASNILSKEFTTIHIETFENKLKINSSKDDIAKINKFLINKDFLVYEISLYSKSLEDEFIEQTESKQII
ncbi:ABC transporter ATP-binding protein [uncultured Clostridium sp.]|jgi:ABC-2 type transport system ATP-binding protein|uniref:ABC transporter ATP-binding protein n=1 Tax=uncultured Clostridium sp. TaxID=59620 RepID=UPI002610F66E|nr:ABC transporter ATP-binding protein [uncultured Clostridium sp.]